MFMDIDHTKGIGFLNSINYELSVIEKLCLRRKNH